MPFYEYQCNACDHRLEALQKISEQPLCYCPECGEASLRKLISKAAFRLKGDGWYETDFKNSGAKKEDDTAGKKGSDAAKTGDDTATSSTQSSDKNVNKDAAAKNSTPKNNASKDTAAAQSVKKSSENR